MKRSKYILLILLSVIMMYSCDDWLYIEPENGVIKEEYWQSENDVEKAVMGCYASLLGNPGKEKGYDIPSLLFFWGELRADMLWQGKTKDIYEAFFNGEIRQDNIICWWNAFYRTINYCNNVLENAGLAQSLDASFTLQKLEQYEAEVIALRALMYFYLVRTFDEVPLKLEATIDDGDERQVSKSTRLEVLNFIKSDLRKAENYLPLSYEDVDLDKGRITRYTVNAIQADVYLWCEQYDSCIIACDKIINSGVFGLLEADDLWFKKLYVDGNSAEGIFELQFSSFKTNPYYNYFVSNRYFYASPAVMEEIFPYDPNVHPDSADIRSDGCSYRSRSGYTIWKYIGLNEDEMRLEFQSYAHFIIYRFADILLFKAEALAQQGEGEQAKQLVDKIRTRARATWLTDFEGDVSNKNDVSDFILSERSREFAYEGKRWFDLLRNAKRNKYERKEILINAVLLSAPSDRQQSMMAKMQDTLSHYLPIYERELNTNALLEQNPFYKY